MLYVFVVCCVSVCEGIDKVCIYICVVCVVCVVEVGYMWGEGLQKSVECSDQE